MNVSNITLSKRLTRHRQNLVIRSADQWLGVAIQLPGEEEGTAVFLTFPVAVLSFTVASLKSTILSSHVREVKTECIILEI